LAPSFPGRRSTFCRERVDDKQRARRWRHCASRQPMEIVGKKSQGLSVTTLEADKTVIIAFNDRSLNFYVTDSLKESLKETINSKIDDGYEHFILNLDNVKIIDSCGVGLIIVANNVTASRSSKLYLSNIKPFIIKIFEIMRIAKHLAIFEREDEALQAIKNQK
jgi:anti-sigma B factor antagonist